MFRAALERTLSGGEIGEGCIEQMNKREPGTFTADCQLPTRICKDLKNLY
jgi:hypothetical protein